MVVWLVFGRGNEPAGVVATGVDAASGRASAIVAVLRLSLNALAGGGVEGGGVDAAEDDVDAVGLAVVELCRGSLGIGSFDCEAFAAEFGD